MTLPIEAITRPLAAAILLFTITACGDEEPAATTTATPGTSTSSTSTTIVTTTTTTQHAADPDVQAEIDWFVSVLNGEELTADQYETRFSEEFRQQVPYAEGFQPLLEDLRAQGPFTLVERSGAGVAGEALIESADGTTSRVRAEIDDQGVFTTLLIQPAETPSLEDPPESVEEAFARLNEMGNLRAIAAEVTNGECQAIEEAQATDPAPLGSVFKLYVLAAVGEAIAAGDFAWDDEIVIRDELKSVPTGTLQDRQDGDTVSVLEAAELMISTSDNTAADHLIDLVGRERVESVMADYGNSSPELNTPFLNTREFTALKVGPASGLRIQWLNGDEDERRAILQQISDITPADLPIQEWVEPIDPDLLEWFASPEDLCTLAVRLSALTGEMPEIGEILAINPGVPAEPGTWDSIWFKGGSEPGLLAVWFVTESGGRTFVTAGSVVDPETAIDSQEAVLLFATVRDLLSP